MNIKRIAFAGGGTGGHIYPLLALARELYKMDRNIKMLYFGSRRGLEHKLIKQEIIPMSIQSLDIQGLTRPRSLTSIIPAIWKNTQTMYKFWKSVGLAKAKLKVFNPQVIVGTGGYVSAPPIYAAHKMRIPILIHEQNIDIGITTRFLSRYADTIAVSFKETSKFFPVKNVIWTGNPRATEVFGVHQQQLRQLHILEHSLKIPLSRAQIADKSIDLLKKQRIIPPIVVIVGGSQGALRIHQAVKGMFELFKTKNHITFVYISGDKYYEEAMKYKGNIDKLENVHIIPYAYDMPAILSLATLCVSRAGATTLAEITSLGLPSILIPSPYATGNHQMHNARLLAQAGAAVLLADEDCSSENLFAKIHDIIDQSLKHKQMHEAAKELGKPQATPELIKALLHLVERV